MFDIGLLSWWYAPNYGAVLTAFALEQYLKSQGYSVLMIDTPDYVRIKDDEIRNFNSPSQIFIRKHCNVSERYKDQVDILRLNSLCKCYIVGSDQMWNYAPGYFKEDGGYYFLDFADYNKKKISYASSFGDNIFRDDSSSILPYIKRFSGVSVREKTGLDICKEFFDVNAEYVVDPVFLLNKDRYVELTVESNIEINNPYLFAYMLSPTRDKWKQILDVAKNEKLKVIYCGDMRSELKGDKNVYCPDNVEYIKLPSIEDWLSLIYYSSKVMTDSYHGVCLSILFQKNFIQLRRDDQPERFKSLYESIGLNDKLTNNIDYLNVDLKFELWIKKSKQWLNEQLLLDEKKKDINALYCQTEIQVLWKFVRELQLVCKQNRRMLFKMYIDGRITGKKVVIRCGGKHTEELLKIINTNNVIGIWDANYTCDTILGLPCFHSAEDVIELNPNAILISSYKYKDDILNELRSLCINAEIIEPYSECFSLGMEYPYEFFRD